MGRYDDLIADNSKFSLNDALDDAEIDYVSDFEEWWGFDTNRPPEDMERDDWLELQKIHGLAKQVAEVASTLLQRKGLGKDRLALPALLALESREAQNRMREIGKQLEDMVAANDRWKVRQLLLATSPSDSRTKYNIFQNTLQIEAARIFPYSPSNLAQRLQTLTDYLVRYPNERTAAYLSRVAKCYVLNMPTEMAIMARAVIDTALQEFVDDDVVRQRIGADRHVGLERRIQYLALLDSAAAQSADFVRQAGDDAVHTAPGLEPEPDRLLAALARVLDAIERNRAQS